MVARCVHSNFWFAVTHRSSSGAALLQMSPVAGGILADYFYSTSSDPEAVAHSLIPVISLHKRITVAFIYSMPFILMTFPGYLE